MRLNKYLADSGACSRRMADTWISAGRVTVDGVVAVLGVQVESGSEVRCDGRLIGPARKLAVPVYLALNKPVGITCTTDRRVHGNIVDFVDHPERIFMIGRLDKMSEGLILLTNDGDIVNEVLRAGHGHEKQYVVDVDLPITDSFLEGMAAGVQLEDARTNPCAVTQIGPRSLDIVLTQGLNRQIRRMCEVFGYRVRRLQRVRIKHIHLGRLPLGRWRNLSEREVAGLAPPPDREPWRPGSGEEGVRS